MAVLVIGGCGYIGSHVAYDLKKQGEEVIIIDNLSTSSHTKTEEFKLHKIDIASYNADAEILKVIKNENISGVIHFAAKKQVGESCEKPVYYYRQNIGGLCNVLDACQKGGVKYFVFSSSAAVYGEPDTTIINESDNTHPINPYGQTKLAGEWLINAWSAQTGIKSACLRYFNVAGAASDKLADEAILNLIPMVLDKLEKGESPLIFGDDWPTKDKTCIRDYIHVSDLSDAHIKCLSWLKSGAYDAAQTVFNVGTGLGASVKEVIDAVIKEYGSDLSAKVAPRRSGDPAALIASPARINSLIGWKAQNGLDEIVKSAVSGWKARHKKKPVLIEVDYNQHNRGI